MSHDPLLTLRERVRRIEQPSATVHGVLPFGVAAIDRALPGGGLARGVLHEILGAGGDEEDGALAAAFAAGIVARLAPATDGIVLWCLARPDLYGPGLVVHGLDPARLVIVRTARDTEILWAMEEGLRSSGVAAVVGEVGVLSDVASRRLQLAAERSGITAFALRRWRSNEQAARERNRPSAAATRWRIAALPSQPIPIRLEARIIPSIPLEGHGIHEFRSGLMVSLSAPRGGEGRGEVGEPPRWLPPTSPSHRYATGPSLSPRKRAERGISAISAQSRQNVCEHRRVLGERAFGVEPGIGHPRWRVELLRCRGGASACWTVEIREGQVIDATDTLSLAPALADRAPMPVGGDVRPPQSLRRTG
jgi:protein ImuA